MDPIDGRSSLGFRHALSLAEGIPVCAVRYVIAALDDLFVVLLCLLLGHAKRSAHGVPDRVTGQVRHQLDALGDVLDAVKGPALELFLQEIAEDDVNGLRSRRSTISKGSLRLSMLCGRWFPVSLASRTARSMTSSCSQWSMAETAWFHAARYRSFQMRWEVLQALKSDPSRYQISRVLDVLIELPERCLDRVRSCHGHLSWGGREVPLLAP